MDNIFVIEDGILTAYTGAEETVIVPAGITRIGKGAFKNSKIRNVELTFTFEENHLKSIDDEAFCGCSDLEYIRIPYGVSKIGDRAFADCTSLKYITIPSSVMFVGKDVLRNHSQTLCIAGEDGSEAVKLAEQYGLQFRSGIQRVVSLFEKAKALRETNKTKTFELWGESIACSKAQPQYFDILEYYEQKKEPFYTAVLKFLPASVQNHKYNEYDAKIASNSFEERWRDTCIRLEKNGVIQSIDTLVRFTYKPFEVIKQLVRSVQETFNEMVNDATNTLRFQKESAFAEAESKVTGLSYGVIGGPGMLALHGVEDFLERQKQRKKATAEAVSKINSFQASTMSNLEREYANILKEAKTVLRQATDCFIDTLCRAEIVALVSEGIIEKSLVEDIENHIIDPGKSKWLLRSFIGKTGDQRLELALALKKNPFNIEAIREAEARGYSCPELIELIRFIGIQTKEEEDYSNAVTKMHAARTAYDYQQVANSLRKLKSFKDSDNLAIICDERAKKAAEVEEKRAAAAAAAQERERIAAEKAAKEAYEARQLNTYNSAVNDMNTANTDIELILAAESFQILGSYKDSKELAVQCRAKAEQYRQERLKQERLKAYNTAVSAMNEAKTPKQFMAAADKFHAIKAYKDSEEQEKLCLAKAQKCRTIRKIKAVLLVVLLLAAIAFAFYAKSVLIPDFKYNNATELLDAGEYTEAKVAFEALEGYKDSVAKIEECNIGIQYNFAVDYMDAGNYGAAYSAFLALGDYNDSIEKASAAKLAMIKNCKPNECIFFGTYEQDGDSSNGTEDIEWLVLNVENGKALVISKNILDAKKYNTSPGEVTWETCSLRAWLNSDFMNAAFSANEKARILPVGTTPSVSGLENLGQDQMFCLSYSEAATYFDSGSERKCELTDYVIANGVIKNARWWLRTSSSSYIDQDGILRNSDYILGSLGVRPAMWIDLNA